MAIYTCCSDILTRAVEALDCYITHKASVAEGLRARSADWLLAVGSVNSDEGYHDTMARLLELEQRPGRAERRLSNQNPRAGASSVRPTGLSG